MSRLAGKVAVVTGAGQGIGRGIAHAMAREGADIAVVGRTLYKLEAVAVELQHFGVRAIAVQCDVSRRRDVEDAVGAIGAELGGVDILVNNAQDLREIYKPLADISDEDMDRSWRSGVMGSLYFMQVCLPHLHGGGKVINVGSAGGIVGAARYPAYSVAKEGIRALTRVAAREWGQLGINVNTICPAADTPTSERMQHEHPEMAAMAESMVSMLPIPRRGRAEEDIGRVAVFLASSDSDYITGHTLMVDGGGFIDAGR